MFSFITKNLENSTARTSSRMEVLVSSPRAQDLTLENTFIDILYVKVCMCVYVYEVCPEVIQPCNGENTDLY